MITWSVFISKFLKKSVAFIELSFEAYLIQLGLLAKEMTNPVKISLPIVMFHALNYRSKINIDDYNAWKESNKDICVMQLRELNKAYNNLTFLDKNPIKLDKRLYFLINDDATAKINKSEESPI